jgi:hypothetical protein
MLRNILISLVCWTIVGNTLGEFKNCWKHFGSVEKAVEKLWVCWENWLKELWVCRKSVEQAVSLLKTC